MKEQGIPNNVIPMPVRDRQSAGQTAEGTRPIETVRLGILGCSGIVPRAVLEPAVYVPNLEVTAAANRTLSKAQHMGAQYGIPIIHDTLDDLLNNSELDAIYIGLSNQLHAGWIEKALRARKHVLVEKPIALDAAELPMLSAAAEQYGVHLAEAMMVAHHPWQQALRQLIFSGEFGALLRTETRLAIPAKDGHQDNYRSDPQQGGGCLWDLGCYWLQFLQLFTRLDQTELEGRSQFDGPNGCDWTFHAHATLRDGIQAEAVLSFEQPYACRHVLHFEQATLTINDFFRCNLGFYKLKFKIVPLRHSGVETEVQQRIFEPANYYVNQLHTFVRDVQQHQPGQPNEPLAEATDRIRALTTLYRSAKTHMALF